MCKLYKNDTIWQYIYILNPRKSNLFLKLQLYLICIPFKEERKNKRSFQSEGIMQNKADVQMCKYIIWGHVSPPQFLWEIYLCFFFSRQSVTLQFEGHGQDVYWELDQYLYNPFCLQNII